MIYLFLKTAEKQDNLHKKSKFKLQMEIQGTKYQIRKGFA